MNCPICLEVLYNLHALSCGHSYCGPPRTCLNTLKHNNGIATKCAVCSTVIQVKVSDLKPLYGIREVLNKISEETHYKEKATALLPYLGNIATQISEVDKEIRSMNEKKTKLEQIERQKSLITQLAEGKVTLTPELKMLLDSGCLELVRPSYRNEVKNLTFQRTINDLSSVFSGFQQSEKYHYGGFLFDITLFYRERDGENWVGAYLTIDLATNRQSHLEIDCSYQAVILSSDPAKNIKLSGKVQKANEWAFGKHKFARWDFLRDPSNGFISTNNSVTFEVYIEYLRLV